jgi:sugar-specific transcriptional regulator TrmB
MNILVIKKTLLEIGLSEMATKVYLQIYQNPKQNITEIAQNLGIYRRKIYESLDELEGLNLLGKSDQRYKEFRLKSPVFLKTMLKDKQHKLNKNLLDFEEVLPSLLTNFFEKGKIPEVRIFDQSNKFKYLFNTILDEIDPKDEILNYNEGDDFYKIVDIDYFFEVWVEKRIKKNIFIRVLANINNSVLDREIPKDSQKYRETRFLKNSNGIKGCYWIIGSKIILWDTIAVKAILIENLILAKLMKNQFEINWDICAIS